MVEELRATHDDTELGDGEIGIGRNYVRFDIRGWKAIQEKLKEDLFPLMQYRVLGTSGLESPTDIDALLFRPDWLRRSLGPRERRGGWGRLRDRDYYLRLLRSLRTV